MPATPITYPQVEQNFMNHDHADFIALRETIIDGLERTPTAELIDPLLDELLSHTVRHFADEEQLMQDAQFPPYPIHQREHERVIVDMRDHVAAWRRERDANALRVWLDEAVGEWFAHHVQTMDQMTAAFVAHQGLRR
jgi:hemerythrin